MLFPYTYVPHEMEKMQGFIDFIFFEVWCAAPGSGDFRLELFDANSDLKELMEAFYYGDSWGGDFFYGHVEKIYDLFSASSSAQIDQLKQAYRANNDIEGVCSNIYSVQTARYADITAIDPGLSSQMAAFFKGLYSPKLLDLAAVRDKIGQIDEHYEAFMALNAIGKCPFCGIADMFGVYHSRREAYDHYLPKKLYPFNSINFKNLTPACHSCNSSYKTTKDPSYSPVDPAGGIARRKSFYPYSANECRIDISIDISASSFDRLTPADIRLTFGPAAVHEEIEAWRDVYGIDERYKAKCCGVDAKDWLEQVRIFRDSRGITPEDTLAIVQEQAEHKPFANSNFLKLAFLEGCHRVGLLQEL